MLTRLQRPMGSGRTRRRDPLNSEPRSPDASSARVPWLLGLGAALGLALAATGLLEPRTGVETADPGGALEPEVAAIVGPRTIRRVDYERMLAGVAQDLRSPIDEATRRRVLERMIDEELLIQRGLALGLAASDRRVRGELVASLVDSVVAEAAGEVPSRTEIERHYAQNADFFTPPARLRVASLFFADERDGEREAERAKSAARERSVRALEALNAGADASRVAREAADPELAPVPDALLPIAKLRDYLGPDVVAALVSLESGGWSEPIDAAGGVRLVRVLEREAGVPPALEVIAELVERDLVRRRGDEALRRYLDALRDEIAIERNERLFAPLTPLKPPSEATALPEASPAASPD